MIDPPDRLMRPWWEALVAETGPLALFDAHTHLGSNDPDGYSQTPEELLAGLDRAGARAVAFAMHEPDGYRAANDAVIAAAEGSAGRLVAFCRVDPHDDAPAEARRALAAGARGIKLHPRAEGFTLAEPAVREVVALAAERRLAVLIHAGRGIPALGRDAVALAAEFPDARLILAHAAVSDLAWLWRVMPEHPNLFIDSSWWNPGDMMALFELVAPGQILWASDSPYTQPLTAATLHMRFALQAGLGPEALRLIAGAQLERVLSGAEPASAPAGAGEAEPLDPLLERIVAHLVTAVGAMVSGGDPREQLALARLACAVEEGPRAPLCGAVLELIELAGRALPADDDDERRFGSAARLVVFALTVARTPAAPLPALPEAPAPTREQAEPDERADRGPGAGHA
ncbi:MAG: amidohydrolase family protein [Solirubrobacterales bacterium]|nr:amidohydrolase family protein [Solirubrobacterales bacterium]